MSEVLEFEYTRRTVPKDSLGVLDDICKDLFSLRTDIKTFPAIRNFVNRAELGVGIVGERIGNLGINSQNKVYAFFFCFLHQIQSQVKFVVLTDRHTDLATESLRECISHTTGDNQVVYLVQQVFNDFNLGRNFGTTHDGSKRTLDIVQNFIKSLYFFFHQVTQHLVISIEVVSDNCSRSVFTVSCTECIHYIAVCVRSQSFSKFFLRSFHSFLCIFVSRIFFFDTYRFSFFFRIETQILEQKCLSWFQGRSFSTCICAVRGKFHFNAQVLRNVLNNLAE